MPTLQVITAPPKFASSRALALRQYCTPVDIDSEEGRKQALWVIQELFEVLYILGAGVGLAAPQLGVLLRIFVVDDEQCDPIALINPEFSYLSLDTEEEVEGCLSIPGYLGRVTRAKEVKIQGISPTTWLPVEISATGYLARVLQHEYDHLNGVLFVDHLESIDVLEPAEPYGVVRARRTLQKLRIKPTAL